MNVIHKGAVSRQTLDCSPHNATATAYRTVLRREKHTLNKNLSLLILILILILLMSFFYVSSKELNQESKVVAVLSLKALLPQGNRTKHNK